MSKIDFLKNEHLWVEKYRPQTVKDCILKKSTKEEFENIIQSGKVPNLLLSGPPGSGKTTVAKAMCKEMGIDYMIINASSERGLDLIRDKITNFATTASFSNNGKCFILDEADQLPYATQAALRNASEEFSKSCGFIMTANYPNRIMPALHSRFVNIDFSADKKELELMQALFFGRITQILDNENVKYDERVLITVIQKFFPDNRRIIGILQQYGRHGMIDEGILMDLEEVNIDKLISAIKAKKFPEIAQWAADNKDNDISAMYDNLYKSLKTWVKGSSIPDAIMILNDSQRYDSIVPSKELHLASMCVELMTQIEFK